LSKVIYKGVLIEQSVSNPKEILRHAKVVGERTTGLESESARGKMRFLNVEVAEDHLWDVLKQVAEGIKQPGWYFHLVGEERMYVVMPQVIFFADGPGDKILADIVEYGTSQCGIHPEQLEIKGLFVNPYG
jgi:hypothetical protein